MTSAAQATTCDHTHTICSHTQKPPVHLTHLPEICKSCKSCTISSIPTSATSNLIMHQMSLECLLEKYCSCSNEQGCSTKRTLLKKILISKLQKCFHLHFINDKNFETVIKTLQTEFSRRSQVQYALHLSECMFSSNMEEFIFSLSKTSPAYLIKMLSWHCEQINKPHYEQDTVMLFADLLQCKLPHASRASDLHFSKSLLSIDLSSLLSSSISVDLELSLKILKIAKKTNIRIKTKKAIEIMQQAKKSADQDLIAKTIKAITKFSLKTHNAELILATKEFSEAHNASELMINTITQKIKKVEEHQQTVMSRFLMGEISYLEKEAHIETYYYKLKTLNSFLLLCNH